MKSVLHLKKGIKNIFSLNLFSLIAIFIDIC